MAEVNASLQELIECYGWLENQGNGIALIHDDHCRWAVVSDGFQPLSGPGVDGRDTDLWDGAISGTWSYCVEATDWFPTVRAAIMHARSKNG